MTEEARVELVVDRTGWPQGPWDGEPDRVEWRTRAGLHAIAQRQPVTGAWCGYVAVPPGHPCHGRTPFEKRILPGTSQMDYVASPVNSLRVHGGITYAERCGGPICHVPAPGEPDNVWWLGFDAFHASDIAPVECVPDGPHYPIAYRTMVYIRSECESLAEQLVAMVSP